MNTRIATYSFLAAMLFTAKVIVHPPIYPADITDDPELIHQLTNSTNTVLFGQAWSESEVQALRKLSREELNAFYEARQRKNDLHLGVLDWIESKGKATYGKYKESLPDIAIRHLPDQPTGP